LFEIADRRGMYALEQQDLDSALVERGLLHCCGSLLSGPVY